MISYSRVHLVDRGSGDLGAIMIIAAFYAAEPSLIALRLAGFGVAAVALLISAASPAKAKTGSTAKGDPSYRQLRGSVSRLQETLLWMLRIRSSASSLAPR
jgi:hypothetical protein